MQRKLQDSCTDGSAVEHRGNGRAELDLVRHLRRSRDQLAVIFQGVTEGILVRDTSARLVYANDAASSFLGYPSHRVLLDALPRDVLSRVDILDEAGGPFPLDRLPWLLALQGVQESSSVICFRSRKTGEERTTIVRSSPILDEQGQVQLEVSSFTDITERQMMMAALRLLADAGEILSASLDYKMTLQHLAGLLVSAWADWSVIYLAAQDGSLRLAAMSHDDPAKEKLLSDLESNYPVGIHPPSSVTEVLRTGRAGLYPEASAAELSRGGCDPAHLEYLEQAGVESLMIVPLAVHNHVLGAMTLVSAKPARRYTSADLSLAEEIGRRCALAVDNAQLYHDALEQREALQTLLDSITEGVLSVSSDLQVERANIFASRLLRLHVDSLEGRPVAEILSLTNEAGTGSHDITELIRRCIAQNESFHTEEAWLKLSDEQVLPIALTVAPQHDALEEVDSIVVLFRDIRQRREVDQLRESIISLVSHELRTPLGLIKGYASSLLQPDTAWDEETRLDFIRTIDRESDRLAKMVNDILEMSRLQGGKIPLRLSVVTPEMLIQAVQKRPAAFLTHHTIAVSIPDDLPSVLADSFRVEQILVNLMENAVKYSKKGTRIEVQACHDGADVIFSVTDQGVGIPLEFQERIFEKFTRLNHPGVSNAAGVGLGLALSKTLVESHGGRIWVESQEGQGSTFYFTLPVAILESSAGLESSS